MSDYKSLLIENRKEKVQEAAGETGIAISKIAAEHGARIYNEKVKKCKGGLFRGPKEDPKTCMLKAVRSSARASITSLKENYSRCDNAESPTSCRRTVQGLIREYQKRIQQVDSQIGG